MSALYNLVEPASFERLFTRFPPHAADGSPFACATDAHGLTFFSTRFDLLTTLEPEPRRRISALPLFTRWSNLFKLTTRFCGTTITEYAPMPRGLAADGLIENLLEKHPPGHSLLIIKDLPDRSPLLCSQDNVFAGEVAEAARNRGFIEVRGQALAYVPIDFSSEDEYLSRLSSGRRKDLRRKLKKRDSIALEALPLGDSRLGEKAFLDEAYAMYMEVFRQSEIHFDRLSPDFFRVLFQGKDVGGTVFLYRRHGALVAYNICLEHEGRLIDKYIGFKYPLARELNLYFISWFVNLNHAREQGLSTYIAGWTDPAVKASLGARFTFTRHPVWVRNPLLRRFLHPLRGLFEADARLLEGAS